MKQLFYGGVHPAEHKEATEQKPIQPLAKAPAQVVIPMSMHIGAPCKPTVQKGATVLVGQMIGATGLLLGIALAMYYRGSRRSHPRQCFWHGCGSRTPSRYRRRPYALRCDRERLPKHP